MISKRNEVKMSDKLKEWHMYTVSGLNIRLSKHWKGLQKVLQNLM